MAVTEYIGPLVGPVFADPAEWTPTRSYEALNVVLNEGNSYTARQDVPVGADIKNENYWLETGNYNAQLESYRKDVLRLHNTVKQYSTVFDMQNDSSLNIGDIAFTQGFHNAGDNGASFYIISLNGTPNGYDTLTVKNGIANLIITGKWLDMHALGAYIDNIHPDDAVFAYAISKYEYLEYKGTAKLTSTLHMPFGKHVDFDTLSINTLDYAVSLDGGVYGDSHIRKITNSIGGGIKITSNADYSLIEFNTLNVDYINSYGNCFYFNNSDGVLDCKINGIYWNSSHGNCIDTSGMQNKTYIGQLKFNVNRCTASNGIGINIVLNDCSLTGADFGYMSLEGCEISIVIDYGNNHGYAEPIRGTFRTIENLSKDTVLKITGTIGYQMGISELRFDALSLDKIDTSGIIGYGWAYRYANIHIISGINFYDGAGSCIRSGYIGTNGFIAEPDPTKTVSTLNAVLHNAVPSILNLYNGLQNPYKIPSTWAGTPLIYNNKTTGQFTLEYDYLGVTKTINIPAGEKGVVFGTPDDVTINMEKWAF